MKRYLFIAAVGIAALWQGPASAMRCRVASGGYGLPAAADTAALADIILGGADALNTCQNGGCNFDGQGGAAANVGDLAMLLKVIQQGEAPGGLCDNTQTGRVLGFLQINTARVAARAAGAAPVSGEELRARAEALMRRSWDLALERARPFQPGPFVAMATPPPPDPEMICNLTNAAPGELLLRLKDPAAAQRVRETAAEWGFELTEQTFPPRFQLRFPRPEALGLLDQGALAQGLRETARRACHVLRRLPGILHVQPNVVRRASAVPTDPLYSTRQWDMTMIKLPHARSVSLGGVVVGVIDTGILPSHPEFSGRMLGGYDFITSSTLAEDGGGRDANPDDTSAGLHGLASHGTHVSGLITAASDNNLYIAGVCPGCQLLPLRALGGPNLSLGPISDEVDALLWGAGLTVSGVPPNANPAKVLNLSLGGQEPCTPEEIVAMSQLTPAGAVLIAAAGNGNDTSVDAPANCPNVIAVGALGPNKTRTSYSTRDENLQANLVMAPGGTGSTSPAVGITSTVYHSPFTGLMHGTSQATPHVAGVVALMKTVNPALDAADIFNLLVQTSEDLGAVGRDGEYGYGLVDAYKAVLAAMGKSPPAPGPVADMDSLTYTGSATVKTVVVQDLLQDPISPTSLNLTPSGSWLNALATTSNVQVGVQTVPTIQLQVTVNRTGLQPGTYQGQVTLVTSSGTLNFPVSLTVTAAVRVVATDTVGTAITQATVTGTQFGLGGIPPGTQFLLKGEVDQDNDGTYCEAGEACGYYKAGGEALTPGQATALTLTPDQTIGGLTIVLRP